MRDSRTSPDDADIARVEPRSSWYWTSEQDVVVSVPDGMRAGQHLTVWFDTDLDPMPEVAISFDVFWCFGAHPPGDSPGAWWAVVSLTRGAHGDSAPNGRRWSPALRGWEPCDPSGGSCS